MDGNPAPEYLVPTTEIKCLNRFLSVIGTCAMIYIPYLGRLLAQRKHQAVTSKRGCVQMADNYTDEEKNALAGIFSLYDQDDSGCIDASELEGILKKIGRQDKDAQAIIAEADKFAQGNGSPDGKINFEEFLILLSASQGGQLENGGADPKGNKLN